MNWSPGSTWVLATVVMTVTACSQAPNGAGDESEIEEAVGVEAAPNQMVIKGRTYRLVGESKKAIVSKIPEATGRAEVGKSHREMSLDELARAVTPVIFTSSGYEYRALAPDYELAKKIQAGFKEMDEAELAEREGRIILGGDGNTDDRTANRNNTTFPNSAFMFSELGCTATMISPSVAITAGHCVYRTDTDQYYVVNNFRTTNSGWRSPRYTAGVDGMDADPFPFNHPYTQAYETTCTSGAIPNCLTITETSTNGPHLGCYTVRISQAFIDSSSYPPPLSEDYAAIDFGACGGHPGNQTGWLSAANLLTQAQIQAAGTANLWGYPYQATNPVSGGVPNLVYYTKWWTTPGISTSNQKANYQEAQLFGMSGTATLPSSSSHEVRYNIDTTGGQSGSSVWRMLNNAQQVFAIHSGAPSSTSTYNWGRRWDSTVKNFVDSTTSWPN